MLLLHIHQLLCLAMLLIVWSYATSVWGRAWMVERLNIVERGGGGAWAYAGDTTIAYFLFTYLRCELLIRPAIFLQVYEFFECFIWQKRLTFLAWKTLYAFMLQLRGTEQIL